MNFATTELTAVRERADESDEVVVELSELDLAMIGGGTGDVHLA